ncbi:MAG: ammonia-forming cytochrome c nitrite reductase subunit c552 [Bacteroidaceae bacterium]|nr:ammonia-forming cytochrome c nitrite reductase subunit c552 [Bacteroidaceae bacterium]
MEAKFAWDKGATDAEMKAALAAIRKSQWRWDFAVASHGASFHAPQEVTRILGHALGYAQEARLAVAKVLAKHGYSGDVPMPDISTKEKAWALIGVDGQKMKANKKKFMETVAPKWIETAKAKGKLIEL